MVKAWKRERESLHSWCDQEGAFDWINLCIISFKLLILEKITQKWLWVIEKELKISILQYSSIRSSLIFPIKYNQISKFNVKYISLSKEMYAFHRLDPIKSYLDFM